MIYFRNGRPTKFKIFSIELLEIASLLQCRSQRGLGGAGTCPVRAEPPAEGPEPGSGGLGGEINWGDNLAAAGF